MRLGLNWRFTPVSRTVTFANKRPLRILRIELKRSVRVRTVAPGL
jgi:hypothetical protein